MNIFDFIVKKENSAIQTMIDITKNAFEKGLDPKDPEFFESIAVHSANEFIDYAKSQICNMITDAFSNQNGKSKRNTDINIEQKHDYTYRF